MKNLFTLLFLLFNFFAMAQTLSVSDEISISSATGYGIIGKYNDRVLFFTIEEGKVKLRAFDAKLHKVWERDIEPDKKNASTILEVIGTRQDFNVIYQFRRKNHNYIKIHKYDGQAKLLDSVTVFDWGRDVIAPKLELKYSEDKKMALIYETVEGNKLKSLAINLDSLTRVWDKTITIKPDWDKADHFEQILFNNQAELYAITEENNRLGSEKHHFAITKYSKEAGEKYFQWFIKDIITLDVKFSFDNFNQQLVAAGLYSNKNTLRAQGHFFISLPPQYSGSESGKFALHPFDDELVSALLGKKVTDNKGLADLKVQEIVHRRDGGILAVVEQVKIVERRSTSSATPRLAGSRDVFLGMNMDYFYENVFAISIAPDGQAQWRAIFHKKQISQEDAAIYSSFFIAKTPSALRFLYNDEVERATTVSEFVLNGAGEGERHAIMNTQGQELMLRFHDATQTGANEIIVPSDDKRRVRLVKIQY